MGWKGFQGGFETRAGSNGEITQEGKAGWEQMAVSVAQEPGLWSPTELC